jgi:hypothetical protein
LDEFDSALLGAIDEALSRLSEPVRRGIYWYLMRRYGLSRDAIPSRPGDFAGGLRALLGRGADVILGWAMEALYAGLGLGQAPAAGPGADFEGLVAGARRAWERSRSGAGGGP